MLAPLFTKWYRNLFKKNDARQLSNQIFVTDYHPDFQYPCTHITAFLFSIDTFILLLKNDIIIRVTPENRNDFRRWLEKHHIREVVLN